MKPSAKAIIIAAILWLIGTADGSDAAEAVTYKSQLAPRYADGFCFYSQSCAIIDLRVRAAGEQWLNLKPTSRGIMRDGEGHAVRVSVLESRARIANVGRRPVRYRVRFAAG